MHPLRSISKPDLIGAAIVVAIGVFLVIQSPEYKLRNGAVIGPGFVPFWFGAAMVVFGFGTAVGAFMRARRLAREAAASQLGDVPDPVATDDEQAGAAENASDAVGAAERWRHAGIVCGISLAAVALTPLLGITVAFALAAIAMLWPLDRERWWISILVSAGVMAILYFLFAKFLMIPIPIGPWGF